MSAAAPDAFTLACVNAEARIDSRLLALHLDTSHQNAFELVKDHRANFEELGILRFQTG